MRVELHTFDPSKVEEVIRFVAEYALKPVHPERRVRRFLTALTSSPSFVFDLYDADERVGVAVLVDEIRNVANCAVLEVLATRGESTPIFKFFVETAKARLPSSFSGIEIGFYPESSPLSLGEFGDLGFHPYYQTFEMETSAPALDASIDLTSWSLLDMKDFDSYYATLTNAFADNVETSLPNRESILKTFQMTALLPHVRKQNDSIVAFVSISHDLLTHVGEIMTVGVHKSARGKGYGREAIAKGLTALMAQGSTSYRLTVEAANENALNLYRQFNFKVVESNRCLKYSRPDSQ